MKRFNIDPVAGAALIYLLFIERSVFGLLSLLAAALHELGHLGAARLLRVRPAQLTIGTLGARIGFGARLLSYREEALIAAAGPAINLLCTGVCVWRLHFLSLSTAVRSREGEQLLFFAAASILLAAINLLPLRSFDGGRILRCFCAFLWGDGIAERVISVITALCTTALWCGAVALWFSAAQNLSLLMLSALLLWRMIRENMTAN